MKNSLVTPAFSQMGKILQKTLFLIKTKALGLLDGQIITGDVALCEPELYFRYRQLPKTTMELFGVLLLASAVKGYDDNPQDTLRKLHGLGLKHHPHGEDLFSQFMAEGGTLAKFSFPHTGLREELLKQWLALLEQETLLSQETYLEGLLKLMGRAWMQEPTDPLFHDHHNILLQDHRNTLLQIIKNRQHYLRLNSQFLAGNVAGAGKAIKI